MWQDCGPRSTGQLVLPEVNQYYLRETKMKKKNVKGETCIGTETKERGQPQTANLDQLLLAERTLWRDLGVEVMERLV